MARTDAFQVEGLVVAVLSDRTCQVQLSNGHRVLGFVGRGFGAAAACRKTGDRVRVELSPFDLSTGRIVVENERV